MRSYGRSPCRLPAFARRSNVPDARCGSLAAVGAADLNVQPTVFSRDAHRPWIAADLAILDVAPPDVELDEDFHLFATVRARHQVGVVCFHLPTFRVVCRA